MTGKSLDWVFYANLIVLHGPSHDDLAQYINTYNNVPKFLPDYNR